MSSNALKIVKYKIITAVLPQHVSSFPRNYRDLRPHPRGVTVRSVPITVEYPRLPRYYRDPHPVQLSSSRNTVLLRYSCCCCSLELEARRDKREREAWEREMRDIRELEFIEKMKHEMELKLPGV